MYTAKTSEIAKLRAYRRELDGLYVAALARRDLPRARAIYGLRRRVLRAILVHEEWQPAELPAEAARSPILEEAEALVERLLRG